MNWNSCTLPVVLAYFATAYLGASIFYLIVTRSYGTPFRDSLTSEQKRIKHQSASQRKGAFMMGFGLSVLLLLFIRPFRYCG